jgi:uncharacterized membrane protein YcaP (DUF421 family)
MKKEEIKFGDWQRILFGEAPPVFLLEVLLRTLLIFVALLVITRLLGKRMSGQLTVTEMAVMLMLGAIVGAGVQMPDRGLLSAFLVLVLALVFQRGVTWLDGKSPKVERVTQGSASLLVRDGIMQLPALGDARLSREQLFALLRNRKIQNLARVDRAYLEACGVFSVYESRNGEKPGLSVLPVVDDEARAAQKNPPRPVRACSTCGFTATDRPHDAVCPNCGSVTWEEAVL